MYKHFNFPLSKIQQACHLYGSIIQHPTCDYFEKGLLMAVNSDDPTMFNTSINQEYRVIHEQFLFTMDDLKQISFNGITASFLSEDAKNDLRTQFEQAWQPVLKIQINI
ncbi:adenosine deaminase [Candidatus Vecturithrix granuli]|uniref:Adenosine deaminase n=1 Tax=Vecturithrix granuli TaxID=1499967 RepID=A0A0S6W9N2_VECG1|nr:adenosine deaminase [Candidatus Vecturithrix granuli]